MSDDDRRAAPVGQAVPDGDGDSAASRAPRQAQPDLRADDGSLSVAVVGAGLSGLAAAVRLLDADPRPRVVMFDAADRVGGAVRTEHAGGFLIEHAADAFLTRPPTLVRFCERLGLADDLIPTNESPRGALVWSGGRTERVPAGFTLIAPDRVGGTLRSRTLPLRSKLRLLAEPLVPRGRVEDESIGSFVRRRLGRGVLDHLAQPLAAGIYAGDVDRLSLHAALPQFAARERTRGRVTRHGENAKRDDAGARYGLFAAPRGGMRTIADAAAAVVRDGGELRLSTPVLSLARVGDGWEVRMDAGAERFDAVILAVPAAVAATLLDGVDGEFAGDLAGVEAASSVVVATGYRLDQVAHPLDAFGLVIPERERVDAFAVSFSSRKFPGRAPDGCVLLRTFLGGHADPAAVRADDGELLGRARTELARLLGARGEPLVSRVVRWPGAMPQYHVGHLARVGRIDAALARHPGLFLAGNSLHGVGLPAAVAAGERAADGVLTGAVAGLHSPRPAGDFPGPVGSQNPPGSVRRG